MLDVSVIVLCRNEEKYIEKTIGCLLDQSFDKPYEIIIVDGMSDDKTRYKIGQLIKKHKNKIKLIDNPEKFVPYAWNKGFSFSNAKYVAIIGGHAFAERDWLKTLYSDITCAPKNVGAVGGVHLSSKDEIFFGRCQAEIFSTFLGGFGSSYNANKTKNFAKAVPFPLIKKDIIKKIGQVDTRFKRVGEDAEFFYRMRKNGYGILQNPEAVVYYNKRQTWSTYIKQIFRYGFGKSFTMRIHKQYIRDAWRSLIPPAFVISLFSLPIISVYAPTLWFLYLAEIICYIALTTITSAKIAIVKRDAKYLPFCFALIVISHISYGVGFMWGLFGSQ